jgi:hypothetical protein
VKFDGFRNNVLLDAKGPGYAAFVRNGEFMGWFQGQWSLIEQARRQASAAPGYSIEWHVAEEPAAFQKLLDRASVTGITVIFTP